MCKTLNLQTICQNSSKSYSRLPSCYSQTYVYIAAVASSFQVQEALSLSGDDMEAAKKVVAAEIIGMCSEEAKCLFNSAFVEAKLVLEESVPPRTASIDERRRACSCADCTDTIRDQSTTD